MPGGSKPSSQIEKSSFCFQHLTTDCPWLISFGLSVAHGVPVPSHFPPNLSHTGLSKHTQLWDAHRVLQRLQFFPDHFMSLFEILEGTKKRCCASSRREMDKIWYKGVRQKTSLLFVSVPVNLAKNVFTKLTSHHKQLNCHYYSTVIYNTL